MNRAKHPREKPVMIVSDYPITTEIENDTPYSSASNLQLLSDLHKVGIKQLDCHCTYLSFERPGEGNYDFNLFFAKYKNIDILANWQKIPFEKDLYCSKEFFSNVIGLLEEIDKVKPKLVIITGKWSLYFLTGEIKYSSTQGTFKSQKPLGGIGKYRASIMKFFSEHKIEGTIIVPIYPPVTKQREPSKIPVMNLDYKKLGFLFKEIKEGNIDTILNPKREIVVGTSYEIVEKEFKEILTELSKGKLKLSVDIETRTNTIDCIGFSYKKEKAFVLPFSTIENPNPWEFEEELNITLLMLSVLTHENIEIIGQNFSYDSQYLHKFYLVNLHPSLDTMIANHVLYNYMDKNLAFLASIYVDNYCYWKDAQIHKQGDIK